MSKSLLARSLHLGGVRVWRWGIPAGDKEITLHGDDQSDFPDRVGSAMGKLGRTPKRCLSL